MGNHRRLMAILLLLCLVVATVAIGCKPAEGPAGPENTGAKPTAGEKAGEKAPAGGTAEANPPAPEEVVDEGLIREGKEEFQSCGTCHCATDPRIEEDEDWVTLNGKTTCIAADKPPRVRKAIMAYLRHPGTLRPHLVGENAESAEGKPSGKLTVPATSGSAYLKAERDSIRTGTPPMVRVYWEAGEAEKTLTVPAGEYRVINYWLYRRSGPKNDERWMASVTNVDGCTTLAVSEEVEGYFATEGVVYGMFTAQANAEGATLTFTLFDENDNRLTLSKNGKVVYPSYRILDAEGKERAGGLFVNT